LSWLRFLRWSTIASIVIVVVINVFAGLIPPLLIFAVAWVGGLIWLRGAEKGPAILLLVAFVLFLGLSAPFIVPTLTVPASAGDFILNLASLLAAIAGILGAISVIRKRDDTGAPTTIGRILIGLFVVGVAISIFSTVSYDDAVAQDGDVKLVTKDIKFSDTSLEAGGGEVSVFIDNQDSTLHTFTIEELGVDLAVPASKSARITFNAEPGTYEFFCRPHEGDMKGKLVIE
jgi:plastocyanin